MDENYLDNLLNEFSLDNEIDHKIEDELDEQMLQEKIDEQESRTATKEEAFEFDLQKDASMMADIDDLQFSEDQIDELDQLDNLADLDIGDLDFSDIDFDDVDITKLEGMEDGGFDEFDDLLKDFEGDLQIDSFFEKEDEEASDLDAEDVSIAQNDSVEVQEDIQMEPSGLEESEVEAESNQENLNEDQFDTDAFLDSLIEESDAEKAEQDPIVELSDEAESENEELEFSSQQEDAVAAVDNYNPLDELEGFSDFGSLQEQDSQEEDLDDLLSMLDGGEGQVESSDNLGEETQVELNTELLDGLDDIEDLDAPPSKKKKKSFMEILFGEPDEDDVISEEELAKIEEAKAAKKAKKEAAKAAKEAKAAEKKEQKALEKGKKQKEDNEKKRVKAEKKAQQRAADEAEAKLEKKLNVPMVIFIFSLFLGGTFLFLTATDNFNYSQAIQKAANYFANKRYRSAYDEISGVEVKEKDQPLKDRIYTVMYVERLYESYESNVKLNREEKALDCLLRAVDKYYEHYEEAEELGIVSDLDYSFSQVQDVLLNRYGINVEQAIGINQLDNFEYVKQIDAYVEQVRPLDNEEESKEE